jgi:hypothetical protein
MGCPDGKWARPDGQLKTRGNEFIYVGHPNGNNGHLDGARAKPLSPFFLRSAFGRTCRRGFRRGSRDFWRPNGIVNGLADEPLGK